VIGVIIGIIITNVTNGDAKIALKATPPYLKDPLTETEANAITACRNPESTAMDLDCLSEETGESIDILKRKWWWILVGNPCECNGNPNWCLSCVGCCSSSS
jgi:hypothetical protein